MPAATKVIIIEIYTYVHVVGPHPAPSLQRRPAPVHHPYHDPAWLLFIFLPQSNLLVCASSFQQGL